jgi:hypothetical protein
VAVRAKAATVLVISFACRTRMRWGAARKVVLRVRCRCSLLIDTAARTATRVGWPRLP